VEEAVMESTAQYWRTVWLELEPYLRLQLAQAFSNRAPRGRKHDFKDAERLVRRLVQRGGRRRQHTYKESTKDVVPPESAADVRRMLAETMAVKAGKMDPKVANTLAYDGTVLLRAYETDSALSADTPAQPYVPLIYRSLVHRDGRKHQADDVIDLETGERVALPAAEAPCALPAPAPSAAPTEIVRSREEILLEILDD